MIRRLTGNVLSSTELAIVLEVNHIGYLVYSPASLSATPGEQCTLHTYLAVRENALDLYGFRRENELELFERLLTLPKIGPKSALQIMSQATLELINEAIANNDPGRLSKMSGIGKKTAEKVVSGLAELYEKEGVVSTVLTTGETAASGQGLSDTIDALIALGYAESVARKAVQDVKDNHPELTETNDIIKAALRSLS